MKHSAQHTLRHTTAVIGALLWATLILGLYYWVHKPITLPLAQAVGGALLDSLIAVLLVLVGGGLGWRVLDRLDLSFLSAPEHLAVTTLIGLSALSLLIFGVGLLALTPASILLILIGVSTATTHDRMEWVHEWITWLDTTPWPRDRWTRFLAITALLMIGLAFVLALLPPTKWDVLTYHLAGPQQYVEHGRFYAVKHNHFLGFPQLADTLYTGQLALTGRLTGAAPIHWIIGLFTLMAAGGYAARRAGAAAGWIAVNTLLVGTSIWMEMTFAYADLLPLGFSIIGLIVAERWQTVRQAAPIPSQPETSAGRSGLGYLLLLGVVAGLGMSTKYTALWLDAGFGILVLFLGRRDGWRKALLYGALYGLVAAATLSPWLIRNLIWYHNPVYPLVFESAEMDAIRQNWYSQPHSGLIYGSDVWLIPMLPVAATFLGVEGAGKFATDIGPLFLILTPLIPLAWSAFTHEERRTIRYALLVSGTIGAIWAVSAVFGSYISLFTRLVLYLFGPLAVTSALTLVALDRLPKKPLDLGFVMKALVSLTLVFMIISGLRFFAGQGVETYFSGKEDYKDDYLEEALGWHYATMQRINQLPAGTTVRFLWEPRYLYCDGVRLHCYADSLMDAWYYARRAVGDGSPAAIADRWQAENVDYVLVYEYGREFEEDDAQLYTQADWTAWDSFVREYLVEEWRNGNPEDDVQYILYTWAAAHPQ